MEINQVNLLTQVAGIRALSEQLDATALMAVSPLNSSFSPVAGVREVGGIHERVLTQDPGSAQNSLQGFNAQVAWLAEALQTELAGFESQDALNSRGLDVADAGGGGGAEAMPIVSQPDPGYSPFGFSMPVVDPGSSIWGLASDLFSTKFWDVSDANARWKALSGEVADIVAGLNESAASLEAENDSEPTTRAAAKIREVAQAGEHFIANAQVMQSKLFGFQSRIMKIQPEAVILASEILAIPEPAARKAAEEAALLYMRGVLQESVIAAMPHQHALMDAAPPSGGGDVSTEFEAVSGDGTRYTTDGVAWPQKIAEAVENGSIGPGSFDVANGQMQGLGELGMDPEEIAKLQAEMRARGRGILGDLGFGDALAPLEATDMSTSAATAGVGGGSPLGVGQVASPSSPGAGLVPSQNGTVAGTTPDGFARGLGRIPENPGTAAAGLGGAGVSGAAAQSGSHPIIGGLPGAAGTGGAREGKASSSVSGTVGTGGGPIGGAIGGAGNSTVSAKPGSGAGAARGAAGMRMMPMMGGMARGGESEKRIKSVTTQAERDPNKRDLLGEPPAVLPGVIGDWAREEN